MSLYTIFCKVNPEEKKLIIKNPHTLHFFCNIDNIKILKQFDLESNFIKQFNDIKDFKYGYKYKRTLNNEFLTSSNIDNNLIKNLYFQNKIKLKLDDKFPKLKYEPRRQRPTTTLHYGQLKLFTTLLQFFTNYIPINKEVHIVYPGSASGNNIHLLTKLFPNCYWYLIDPSHFYYKLHFNDKILYMSNKYFTNDDAKYFKKKLKNKYTIFISDIRDTDLNEQSNIGEIIVNSDMNSQYNWCKILNADISFLKFRMPRLNQNEYKYIDGEIYIQAFANTTTTETRLVSKKNAKDKIYYLDDYEDKLYYHNRVLRVCDYSKLHKYKYKYFCNCYDCSLFFLILEDYINKYNKKLSVYLLIKTILHKLENSKKLKNKYLYIMDNVQ